MDASANPMPRAVKFDRFDLDRKGTVEAAFIKTLSACLDHFDANRPAVLEGHRPEGVHQMRVAIRRLRSAVQVYRPALRCARIEELTEKAKALAATLGRARDLDVLRDEMIAPVRAHYGDTEGLRQLREQLEGRRIVAWANALAAVREPAAAELEVELRTALLERGWRRARGSKHEQPVTPFAGKVLKKRFRAAKRLAGQINSLSTPERHQLRIRLKKLRYASEFFRGLYPGHHARAYIKALSRLQDQFGYLNDVATAERLLGELTGGSYHPKPMLRAEGLVLGWHVHAADAAWPEARGLWEALEAKTPFWV